MSNGFSANRGANEPSTPGKGSEVPLNADRPLKPGERVEKADGNKGQRPRPESPGGAGDMKRIDE